ncbi:MAG TPA: response regulator [Terriglobales bacterium]|nr:response regulator [Terriglobales bacterium]
MNQKKILVVDDEPSIRFIIGAILEQNGYKVEVGEDGFSALRKLNESMPDLVITDMRMPNMNGFELLSVLRTRFPELPTIAISGEFFACHIDEGSLADAFFQKGNYSIPEFLGKVSDLLHGPRHNKLRPKRQAPVWTPVGDAPVMLTCTNCLRSFPIDPCDGSKFPKRMDCLFCGSELDVQLVAVGMTATAS